MFLVLFHKPVMLSHSPGQQNVSIEGIVADDCEEKIHHSIFFTPVSRMAKKFDRVGFIHCISLSPHLLFSLVPFHMYPDQSIQIYPSSMFFLDYSLSFLSPPYFLVSVDAINHSSLSAYVLHISFSSL